MSAIQRIPRRNAKKPSYLEESLEESMDLEDEAFELTDKENDCPDEKDDNIEESEDWGSKKRKRDKAKSTKKDKRNKKKPKKKAAIPILSEDVMRLIASHLHPRDLFSLTRGWRQFGELVSFDMIIPNAMVLGTKGTNQKNSLNCAVTTLAKSVRARKVIVPSPMRLLRLLNGKRCEFHCCNRKTSLNQSFCMSLGLFLCKSCYDYWCIDIDKTGRGIGKGRTERDYTFFGAHHTRMLRAPFHSKANGEIMGPIMSLSDVDDMMFERKSEEDVMKRLDEVRRTEFLEIFDKFSSSAKHHRFGYH